VDRVRSAQRDPETVRVVLDLPGRDDVRFYRLDDPPRLIVDVGTRLAEREARGAARAGGGAHPAPQGGSAATGGEEEGVTRPVRRVVVDAGHGGIDPGAIGPTGVREKDVTLAMSRRLAERLQKAGFEVVMTRSDDRYVALEERTAIANARKGDLFVSIHANANPRRSLAGVETWVLNVADDRYANRLAARENGVDPDQEAAAGDARRILTDLDARSATDASRRLAQQVQREITGSVRERVGEVQDLGVKSALFYVLLGARMPAVLVETAFISNRKEERLLASPSYQDLVAASLFRAVEQYGRRDARVASAAAAEAP
jgi:N-acetylmuramoyl-L-alanine amidase